jgi:hypothetical protein
MGRCTGSGMGTLLVSRFVKSSPIVYEHFQCCSVSQGVRHGRRAVQRDSFHLTSLWRTPINAFGQQALTTFASVP